MAANEELFPSSLTPVGEINSEGTFAPVGPTELSPSSSEPIPDAEWKPKQAASQLQDYVSAGHDSGLTEDDKSSLQNMLTNITGLPTSPSEFGKVRAAEVEAAGGKITAQRTAETVAKAAVKAPEIAKGWWQAAKDWITKPVTMPEDVKADIEDLVAGGIDRDKAFDIAVNRKVGREVGVGTAEAAQGAVTGAIKMTPQAIQMATAASNLTVPGVAKELTEKGISKLTGVSIDSSADARAVGDMMQRAAEEKSKWIADKTGISQDTAMAMIGEQIPWLFAGVPGLEGGAALTAKVGNKIVDNAASLVEKASATANLVAAKAAPVAAGAAVKTAATAVKYGTIDAALHGLGVPTGLAETISATLTTSVPKIPKVSDVAEWSKNLLKTKLEDVVEANRAIAKMPMGTRANEALANLAEERAGTLQESVDAMTANLAKTDADTAKMIGERNSNGGFLYEMEDLPKEAQKIRQKQLDILDLNKKAEGMRNVTDLQKVVDHYTKKVVGMGLHTLEGAAVGAGFTGATAPTGKTEEPVAQGAIIGGLLGGAASPLSSMAGQKALRFQKGHEALMELGADNITGHNEHISNPVARDYAQKTAGLMKPLGYKVEVTNRSGLQDVQGLKSDQSPGAAFVDHENKTVYLNGEHVDPIRHEFTHVTQRALGEVLREGDPEGMKRFEDKYGDAINQTGNIGKKSFNTQQERDAEIGRLVLQNVPIENLYGGETGGDVAKRWFNSMLGEGGTKVFGGFEAPYTRGDIAKLKQRFYKAGEMAATGKEVAAPPPVDYEHWSPEQHVMVHKMVESYVNTGMPEEQAAKLVAKELGTEPPPVPQGPKGITAQLMPEVGKAEVNIGLNVGPEEAILPNEAVDALKKAGVKVEKFAVHRPAEGEATVWAKLDRPLTPDEAHSVSAGLQQEAIAQHVGGGKGDVHGPQAEKWAPFKPEYFVQENARSLAENLAAGKTGEPAGPTKLASGSWDSTFVSGEGEAARAAAAEATGADPKKHFFEQKPAIQQKIKDYFIGRGEAQYMPEKPKREVPERFYVQERMGQHPAIVDRLTGKVVDTWEGPHAGEYSSSAGYATPHEQAAAENAQRPPLPPDWAGPHPEAFIPEIIRKHPDGTWGIEGPNNTIQGKFETPEQANAALAEAQRQAAHPEEPARLADAKPSALVVTKDPFNKGKYQVVNSETGKVINYSMPKDVAQGVVDRSNLQFMPSPHPNAIEFAAIRRKEDGEIFTTAKSGMPHFSIGSKVPDYLGPNGHKLYEEGFVDKQGKWHDREQAFAKMQELGQLPKGYQPQYAGEASAKELQRVQMMPEVPTDAEVTEALKEPQKAKVGDTRDLPAGTPVGLRIDIPAYNRTGKYVVTVHDGSGAGVGRVLGYDSMAVVDNPTFYSNEAGAKKIREGSPKFPVATVKGEFNPTRDIPEDIHDYTQVGYNPKKHSYFYDKATGEPVVSGDQAISAGNTVYVKNPKYTDAGQFQYMPESPEAAREASAKHAAENPEAKPLRWRLDDNGEVKMFPKKDKNTGRVIGQEARPMEEAYNLADQPVAVAAAEGITDKALAHEAKTDAASVPLEKFYNEVKDNPEIMQAKGWYRELKDKLQKKLGGSMEDLILFTRLLAVTSPNTNPGVNFGFALEAWNRFRRGEYKDILAKYSEALDQYKKGTLDYKGKPVTTQDGFETYVRANDLIPYQGELNPKTGKPKKLGMHSLRVMDTLSDHYDRIEGLKINQFAHNLAQTDLNATIDLWAARTLHRVLNEGNKEPWRIAMMNEKGINPHDFKFGQDAFRKAAERIGVSTDDLQAILWFAEKVHYDKMGWSKYIDKGDYRPLVERMESAGGGTFKLREEPAPVKSPKRKKQAPEQPFAS